MIWIKALDTELLLAINQMNSPFLDRFFWLFSSIPVWIPLYISIAYAVVKPNFKIGLTIIALMVLTFILTDQISSTLFKNIFERLRPTHQPELEGVVRIINGYRGGMFGFISGHAANSFGLATITALIFRNKWLTFSLFLWATVNCYSRIYLGVHYPGDVLGGAIVGVTVAFATHYVYKLLSVKYNFNEKWYSGNSYDNMCYSRLIIVAIFSSMLMLVLVSKVMLKFVN